MSDSTAVSIPASSIAATRFSPRSSSAALATARLIIGAASAGSCRRHAATTSLVAKCSSSP
ncbi:hypothetical protein [Amycolatopsis plumensis]|uniref:Uncharacterized protein n=1 Tax=Amycolatopsis plumensis TaxID=236508 RepID=A0ABV5UDQ3_9PSEU